MLTRKPDAQMDFDFAKVVEASKDNPVFYVQYAHARIASTLRKARGRGPARGRRPRRCSTRTSWRWSSSPRSSRAIVESAAAAREPHRIAFYLDDLAAAFHALWNKGNDDPDRRFLVAQNPDLTRARLDLAAGDRANHPQRSQHHGRDRGRGDVTMPRRRSDPDEEAAMSDDAREDLELADEDRLPWLEAVEEDEGESGPSVAKLVAAIVIGLVAIGIIVGGLFWLGNRGAAAAATTS